MKHLINILNTIFDAAWFANSKTGNYIYIIVFCIISSCIVLLLFKKISNQEMIKHHRRKTFGYILQIRLYQDNFILLLLSIMNIFKHNILYIRYALTPLAIIIFPIFIISSQINIHCGYAPFSLNDTFIISAEISHNNKTLPAGKIMDTIYCKTSPGIKLETPALRIPQIKKVFWRARILSEGKKEFISFGLKNKSEFLSRRVATTRGEQIFTQELNKWHVSSGLIHNAEGFLPQSSLISSSHLNYERAAYPFLFWNLDPMIIYFILTLFFCDST